MSVPETLTSRPGIVDLWCVFSDTIDDPRLSDAYEALMAPEERERHGRLVLERDRRSFITTRALARVVLSRYAAVDPAQWRFEIGYYGKPRISYPPMKRSIYFNIANTAGFIVCAVSLAHRVLGVDAEAIDRPGETISLAARFFAPSETHALTCLPPVEQRERFFAYWTLKESYVKARGMGLSIPLDQFAFDLERPSQIRIAFNPLLQDDPERWQFSLLRASKRHLVALAADTEGAPLSLRATSIVPLRGDALFPE